MSCCHMNQTMSTWVNKRKCHLSPSLNFTYWAYMSLVGVLNVVWTLVMLQRSVCISGVMRFDVAVFLCDCPFYKARLCALSVYTRLFYLLWLPSKHDLLCVLFLCVFHCVLDPVCDRFLKMCLVLMYWGSVCHVSTSWWKGFLPLRAGAGVTLAKLAFVVMKWNCLICLTFALYVLFGFIRQLSMP